MIRCLMAIIRQSSRIKGSRSQLRSHNEATGSLLAGTGDVDGAGLRQVGGDTQAPTAPVLTATAISANQINLSWTASTDNVSVTSYTLQRSGDNINWTTLYVGLNRTYSDTGLSSASTYYYRVRAADAAGNNSSFGTASAFTAGGEAVPTKIVQANGVGGAYTTIQSAINAAVAGDIIEVRANTPGSTQQFVEALRFENKNYASYVTLRVRTGDTIQVLNSPAAYCTGDLDGSNSWPGNLRIALFIKASSYIKFTGKWIFGTNTDWVWPNYMARHLTMCLAISNSSHHIQFEGPENDYIYFHGSSSYFASRVTVNSYKLRFYRCRTGVHGSNNNQLGADQGDAFRVESYQTILDSCYFELGGHNPLTMVGGKQVCRNTTFNGDWRAMNTGSPGQRGMEVQSAHSGDRKPLSAIDVSASGPVLMESCHFKNNWRAAETVISGPSMQHKANHSIVRYNLFTDLRYTDDSGAPPLTLSDTRKASFAWPANALTEFYHNTTYWTNGIYECNVSAWPDTNLLLHPDALSYNRIRNNLFQACHARIKGTVDSYRTIAYIDLLNVSTAGYPNGFKGGEFSGNVLDYIGAAGYDKLQLANAVGAGTTNFVGGTLWPDNVFDNTAYTATFTNLGVFANRTRAGFTPTPNQAALVAGGLETAVGSGTNSKTLVVSNARPFYDGWGLEEFGEQGDLIKVGSNSPVRIVSANYATNTLTLASAITWANGAAIYLCLSDGTIVDQKGAMQ